jgi:DNA-binding MarR family transcriptional regulator
MSSRTRRERRTVDTVGGGTVTNAEREAIRFHLAEKPGFLFRRLDTRATLLYQKHTRQSEITPRQFGVLLTLFQRERLTQAELSKAMFIDKSTLGEMVQRMVDRGLVRRRVSLTDRRTAELHLSELGRKFLMNSVAAADTAMDELLAPLPAEYRPLFLKCLRLLVSEDNGPVALHSGDN